MPTTPPYVGSVGVLKCVVCGVCLIWVCVCTPPPHARATLKFHNLMETTRTGAPTRVLFVQAMRKRTSSAPADKGYTCTVDTLVEKRMMTTHTHTYTSVHACTHPKPHVQAKAGLAEGPTPRHPTLVCHAIF